MLSHTHTHTIRRNLAHDLEKIQDLAERLLNSKFRGKCKLSQVYRYNENEFGYEVFRGEDKLSSNKNVKKNTKIAAPSWSVVFIQASTNG